MKLACTSFAGGTLKAAVAKGLPRHFSIPLAIRELAHLFVALQEQRHMADYDLTERFSRTDVLRLVGRVETVLAAFASLPPSAQKKFFLACLLAWPTLAGR